MDLEAFWSETRAELADAYRGVVGFAIGAVEAVAILLIATFLARRLRRRVERGFGRTGVDRNVAALAANAVSIGTYVVALSLVLAVLGASWTALITVLGASTVAVSLALQDVLRSFVAGVYLLLERPFAIGDRIKVNDVEGTVEGIDIRTTALRDASDELVLLPNATLFAGVLTNRSAASTNRTTLTLTGVETPLGQIRGAVVDALSGIDGLGDRPPTVEVVAVGTDGAELTVTIVHGPGDDPAPPLFARLRDRFPEASVSLGRPA